MDGKTLSNWALQYFNDTANYSCTVKSADDFVIYAVSSSNWSYITLHFILTVYFIYIAIMLKNSKMLTTEHSKVNITNNKNLLWTEVVIGSRKKKGFLFGFGHSVQLMDGSREGVSEVGELKGKRQSHQSRGV